MAVTKDPQTSVVEQDADDPSAEPRPTVMPSANGPHARYRDRRLVLTEEDVFTTWRVLAHNPNFSGETEGFGFHNGVATIGAYPRTAAPGRVARRLQHLHGLNNYTYSETVEDARGNPRLRSGWTYTFLTEEEYEKEYGGSEDGFEDDYDEVAAL